MRAPALALVGLAALAFASEARALKREPPASASGSERGAESAPSPAGSPAPSPSPASVSQDWLLEDDFGPDPAERDRVPRLNRRLFAFNEHLYTFLLDPISRAYQFVTPSFLRDLIHNAFENLDDPVVFANDVLQADPCRAARTLSRFALNSTVGVLGLVDVASEMGIAGHDTDFGETLGRYGVPSGSYFVLPVFGPSTLRDAPSELVDTALRPEVWLLGPITRMAVTGTSGLATYDIDRERLEALRETSVDFYAALRGAYLMDRDAHIAELRASGRCGWGAKPAEAEASGSD